MIARTGGSAPSSRPPRPVSTYSVSATGTARVDTLKRGINRFVVLHPGLKLSLVDRFSVFVQSGGEDFFAGRVKDVTIDPNDLIRVDCIVLKFIFNNSWLLTLCTG